MTEEIFKALQCLLMENQCGQAWAGWVFKKKRSVKVSSDLIISSDWKQNTSETALYIHAYKGWIKGQKTIRYTVLYVKILRKLKIICFTWLRSDNVYKYKVASYVKWRNVWTAEKWVIVNESLFYTYIIILKNQACL